jgi:hypothetical protein
MPEDFVRTPNPDPATFSERAWNFIQYLQNVSPPFKTPLLGEVITSAVESWKAWVESKEP